MKDKRKVTLEYRHYDIHDDLPILALLGEGWIRHYEKERDRYHFHNYLEIGYCYWGEGLLDINGSQHFYGPGSFTFIPKNIPHYTASQGDSYSKWAFLFVDLKRLCDFYNTSTSYYLQSVIEKLEFSAFISDQHDSPLLGKELSHLIQLLEDLTNAPSILLCNTMVNWIIQVANTLESDTSITHISPHTQLFAIAPAITYTATHFQESLTIGQLAEQCLMSEPHFRKQFTTSLHMSPLEYIHHIRIQHACRLLISSNYSIAHIGNYVGYCSMTTFIRNFKKIIGLTPLKWRNLPENKRKNLANYTIRNLEGWF